MKHLCENWHVFEHAGKMITNLTDSVTVEVPVCPICYTSTYSEYVLDKKQIINVISVDIADVDDKLKEGYEVESLYAKTATLVKRQLIELKRSEEQ